MRLSIINDQVYQDLDQTFSTIKNEGYDEVELHNVFGHSIETSTKEEVKKIKDLLKKYDLKVSNIASTVFFLCPLYPEDKVSLFNPSFYCIKGDFKVHLQSLKNACSIAKELGCPSIRIFPFRWPDNRKPPFGTQEHFDKIIENIKKAVQIAKEENRILALENCPYSHLPKGEMTLRVVKEIDDEHLRLLWDPANSYRAIKENVPIQYQTWTLEKELEELYPYICHVHLKDYHYDVSFPKPFQHVAIGNGDIDTRSILRYLSQRNYEGALSLEPEVNLEATLLSMRRIKTWTKR